MVSQSQVWSDARGEERGALGASLSRHVVVLRVAGPRIWCFPGIQWPRQRQGWPGTRVSRVPVAWSTDLAKKWISNLSLDEKSNLLLHKSAIFLCQTSWFIELDDGKIYRKPLYLMVKTMVSCRFSLKPIHWLINFPLCLALVRPRLLGAGCLLLTESIDCQVRLEEVVDGKAMP